MNATYSPKETEVDTPRDVWLKRVELHLDRVGVEEAIQIADHALTQFYLIAAEANKRFDENGWTLEQGD